MLIDQYLQNYNFFKIYTWIIMQKFCRGADRGPVWAKSRGQIIATLWQFYAIQALSVRSLIRASTKILYVIIHFICTRQKIICFLNFLRDWIEEIRKRRYNQVSEDYVSEIVSNRIKSHPSGGLLSIYVHNTNLHSICKNIPFKLFIISRY